MMRFAVLLSALPATAAQLLIGGGAVAPCPEDTNSDGAVDGNSARASTAFHHLRTWMDVQLLC
jgi:hypothetical protein